MKRAFLQLALIVPVGLSASCAEDAKLSKRNASAAESLTSDNATANKASSDAAASGATDQAESPTVSLSLADGLSAQVATVVVAITCGDMKSSKTVTYTVGQPLTLDGLKVGACGLDLSFQDAKQVVIGTAHVDVTIEAGKVAVAKATVVPAVATGGASIQIDSPDTVPAFLDGVVTKKIGRIEFVGLVDHLTEITVTADEISIGGMPYRPGALFTADLQVNLFDEAGAPIIPKYKAADGSFVDCPAGAHLSPNEIVRGTDPCSRYKKFSLKGGHKLTGKLTADPAEAELNRGAMRVDAAAGKIVLHIWDCGNSCGSPIPREWSSYSKYHGFVE